MTKYELTEEHRAQLQPWAEKWIKIALRTEPQTAADRKTAAAGIRGCYKAASLKVPDVEVWTHSPITAALASVGAGMWRYLRAHDEACKVIFDRSVTEEEIAAGCMLGVSRTVTAGMAAVRADKEGTTCEYTAGAVKAAVQACAEAADSKAVFTGESNPMLDQIASLTMRAMSGWSNPWCGGNQWAGWCAFLSFFDRVVGLDLPEYKAFRHYEAAAIHSGPRFVREDFWIASGFPTEIHRDEGNLPHCATGPAVAWADGWRLYYWHGTRIPATWIEDPKSLTVPLALGQTNVELRRIAVEIIGWEKVLRDVPHRVLDTDPNPEIGMLIAVDLPDAPDTRFVRAKCGTGRLVHYRTDSTVKTALEAAARSYEVSTDEYLKMEVRT